MKRWGLCFLLLLAICILILGVEKEPKQVTNTIYETVKNSHIMTIGLEGEERSDAGFATLCENPTIRVCIKTQDYSSLYHKNVKLTCDHNFYVQNAEGLQSLSAGDVWSPGEKEDYLIIPEGNGRILLLNHQRSNAFGGYRGMVTVVYKENGWMIVNELPLEEYLCGVVPSEMPSAYPSEALKAQAVCARSYAYDKLLHPAYEEADLDDSTSFQVYASIPEQESTNKAVEATRGQVLVDTAGGLLETMYYSTSMGENNCKDQEQLRKCLLTVNPSDAEADMAYYRWTYFSPQPFTEQLYKRLGQCGEHVSFVGEEEKPFTSVSRIEITKRGPHMEATACEIETDTGIYLVEAEYYVRKVLSVNDGFIVNNQGETIYGMELLPSPFFVLDCIVAESRVVEYNIRGGGFGHGKGMSQNGAKALAKRGCSFEEILAYYYR